MTVDGSSSRVVIRSAAAATRFISRPIPVTFPRGTNAAGSEHHRGRVGRRCQCTTGHQERGDAHHRDHPEADEDVGGRLLQAAPAAVRDPHSSQLPRVRIDALQLQPLGTEGADLPQALHAVHQVRGQHASAVEDLLALGGGAGSHPAGDGRQQHQERRHGGEQDGMEHGQAERRAAGHHAGHDAGGQVVRGVQLDQLDVGGRDRRDVAAAPPGEVCGCQALERVEQGPPDVVVGVERHLVCHIGGCRRQHDDERRGGDQTDEPWHQLRHRRTGEREPGEVRGHPGGCHEQRLVRHAGADRPLHQPPVRSQQAQGRAHGLPARCHRRSCACTRRW